MLPQASQRTAAVAGAWTVFGLVPFESWIDSHKISSVLSSNFLWLAALAVFLVVPGYFFVVGRGNERFGRTWFLDAEGRAKYGAVGKRMFVWFGSAGAAGTVWSLIVSYVLFNGAVN
jgi:hypothetical protein